MTTLNARAGAAYQALVAELEAEDQVLEFSSSQGAFEEGWETGYKTAVREVSKQIADEIQMYNQEWSANTWRSIAARIAREVGEASS